MNINYNVYDNINLSIADGYSLPNNSNFVSNYLFYIENANKYKMITMNTTGTYDVLNTKKISVEFTKDLSLNDFVEMIL